MATRFTHVTFTVSDFDRSIAFYRDVCGMTVVRDRRREGGGTVWLGPTASAEALPPYVLVIEQGAVTDRIDHLAFQCDTREEFEEKALLGARMGIVDRGPTDAGGSVGSFVILRDPDGHGVEFTHGQPILGVA